MGRYRGTDPPDTMRQRLDGVTQPYDERPAERRQLFRDDDINPAAFTDIVMQEVGAEAADLQSLIAVMNPTQLATSLQHMALQYRDLQNAATGIWDTDEDDRVAGRGQPLVPPSGAPPARTHCRYTPELTRDDDEEYAFEDAYPRESDTHRQPSIHDDMPHPAWHTATADKKARTSDPPCGSRAARSTPTVTQRPIPPPAETREEQVIPEEQPDNSRQRRMPAAKLETFAGQGASVEAFLAKFEGHALGHGWN